MGALGGAFVVRSAVAAVKKTIGLHVSYGKGVYKLLLRSGL